jgi:hypothetical protein
VPEMTSSFIFVRALTVAMYLHLTFWDEPCKAEIVTIVSCMALGGG